MLPNERGSAQENAEEDDNSNRCRWGESQTSAIEEAAEAAATCRGPGAQHGERFHRIVGIIHRFLAAEGRREVQPEGENAQGHRDEYCDQGDPFIRANHTETPERVPCADAGTKDSRNTNRVNFCKTDFQSVRFARTD